MNKLELEKRTKAFAISTIRFLDGMPNCGYGRVLGNQLLRSATSIGANYREANRAESRKDFAHKIAIVEKEAAESQYWIELFEETMAGNAQQRHYLLKECTELLAIFTRIGRTMKRSPKFEIRNSKFEIQ